MVDTLADDGRATACTVDLVAVPAGLDAELAGQISLLLGSVSEIDSAHLAARQEARVRRAILLVDEFRSHCMAGANARLLAVVLEATIRCAHHLFTGITQGECATAQFAADSNACLTDLMRMLETLTAGDTPPAFELAHAMDALIIQLVRITAGGARASRVNHAVQGLAWSA